MSSINPNTPQVTMAMPEVAPQLLNLWVVLRKQVTSDNNVVEIDGVVHSCLNEEGLDWLARHLSLLVNGPVKYVRDCVADRVYLGPENAFPPGSFMTRPSGGFVLVHPEEMIRNPNAVGSNHSGGPGPSEKVPRPPNAFILYRKDYHEVVKTAYPGIHNTEISKIIGAQWQNETEEVRTSYRALAEQTKNEHSAMYPNYQYQPRRPSEKKRRLSKKQAMVAQKLFEEDHAGQQNYVTNFLELSGSWTDDRVGMLPGGKDLLNAVKHHNDQQQMEECVRPRKFGTTLSFEVDKMQVRSQVPWDSIMDQHDGDVAGTSFDMYINAQAYEDSSPSSEQTFVSV